MGQRVNPNGFRTGINRTWDSKWYISKRLYADLLLQDVRIRKFIKEQFPQAGVSRILIERHTKKACITMNVARPGSIIGKRGTDIEKLKQKLSQMVNAEVQLNVVELRKPELDAVLVAQSIAQQIEKRISHKRAMKRAIQSALRLGAQGVRVTCSGRLGGAEIARSEEYLEGRVPLHTLRADIDFGRATAYTTYGTCGVKVWIFKGEVMTHDPYAHDQRAERLQANR